MFKMPFSRGAERAWTPYHFGDGGILSLLLKDAESWWTYEIHPLLIERAGNVVLESY